MPTLLSADMRARFEVLFPQGLTGRDWSSFDGSCDVRVAPFSKTHAGGCS